MIRRLATLALLLPSLAACCCPRTERCCSAPCDPCGSNESSSRTGFRVLGGANRPPALLAPGPGLTVRIEKLNPNEPLPTKIDFEPPAPTDASREASKPALMVHAVSDLVGGDVAKMDALLGKLRTFIVAGAGESASAQGVVAIVVKAAPLKQLLVKGLLNDERAGAGVPLPPAGPPPVAPTPSAGAPVGDDVRLVLQLHAVGDLVDGEQAKIDELVASLRPLVLAPGSSVAQQGTLNVVVKGTRRDHTAVATMLHDLRAAAGLPPPKAGPPPVAPPDPVDADALKLMYFDVSDLIAPGTPAPDGSAPPSGPGSIDPAKQDALLASLRPLVGDGEGRMLEFRSRTLIVKAPRAVLDTIRARLEALRGAK